LDRALTPGGLKTIEPAYLKTGIDFIKRFGATLAPKLERNSRQFYKSKNLAQIRECARYKKRVL